MNRRWALGIVWLMCVCLGHHVCAQQRSIRVMTYNVENLFDTCRNVLHNDQEFLPTGSRVWNTGRFRRKLSQIARAIATAGGDSPVELVALCEVENDSVVHDLVRRSPLASLGYRFVATCSNDSRGLDVALLYQPERFRLLMSEALRVPFIREKEVPTRDILHVLGRLPSGDSLDVFVCHFPSRGRGQRTTEPYRVRAAQCLKHAVDSIEAMRMQASIVIVGDFNDEPQNKSFVKGMQAIASAHFTQQSTEGLVLLSDTLHAHHGAIAGTYFYKGKWNRLDHIIVNAAMLQRDKGLRVTSNNCRILAFPFLLKRDENDATKFRVNRTYSGSFYNGGTSDHLPLLLELKF